MSPTPTRAPRQLGAQVFALVVLAALLGLVGPLGRWSAAAIAIYLWPLARVLTAQGVHRGPAKIRALAHQLRAQAPLLVVLAAAAYTLFPLWLGQAPASRDHSVHYLQSQVFVDQLLEHGRLRGPSFALNSGYPFGDSYPVLGYALTSALHLITAKFVSLRTSYALGLCAVWALHIWAVAAVAKRACVALDLGPWSSPRPSTASPSPSPNSLGAWAGAAAALAFLFDPGAARQGGWNYTMFHGVWPQLLSTALFLASLELGLRAREQRSWRSIARFAAVWAASIVAHPFGWITGAIAMVAWPLWGLASAYSSRSRAQGVPTKDNAPARASAWVWAIPAGVVLMLVAHHVVVFLLSRGAMARVPVPWLGLGELTRALVLGEIFTGRRALVAVLASFGFVLALRRRAALPLALSALFALLLVLASRESITVLRLDLSLPGLENLQFPRYAFALKGLWCVLAGLGAAGAMHLLRDLDGTRETDASSRPHAPTWPGPARAFMAIVLGPLLASALEQPANALPRPVGATESFAQTRAGPGDRALRAAIERERDAGVPLGRIAFLRAGMRGATYPLFAIVDAGLPVVLDAHIPSINFRHRLHERGPEALRAMGVTHVIYMPSAGSAAAGAEIVGLAESDAQLVEELERIEDPRLQAHGIEFARLRRGNPVGLPWARARPDSGAAQTSAHVRMRHLGGGEAELRPVSTWAGEGFALDVESADPDTAVSVELAIAPYRAWVLRDAAGKAVDPAKIFSAQVAGGTPGMRVSLVPGSYRLRWERDGLERASAWLSLIAWFLVLGVAFWPARRLAEPRPRLTATAAPGAWGPAGTHKLWLLVPVAAALIFAVKVQQERKLQSNWRPHFDDAPGHITDFVVSEAMRPDPRQSLDCSGVDGRDAMEGCTAATHASYVDFSYRRPKIFRCLSMELQAGQRRSLFVGDTRNTRLAAFATGPGTVRLGQGELSVAADRIGRRRLKLKRRVDSPGVAPAGWPLWVENQGDEATRVCVAAAGLRLNP